MTIAARNTVIQLRILIYTAAVVGLIVAFSGCKKDDLPVTGIETGTMTDSEGHVYKTVKIGNKWWMAQNLAVTVYRNGARIKEAKSDIEWNDTSPAYCTYYNNTSTATGLLYNYAVINNENNIAPEGWHIPTDAEWKELEKAAGLSQTDADNTGWRGKVADALKIKSPEGWTVVSDVWSTNASGFSADAGSCRLPEGTFGDPGLFATGFWWTSTTKGDKPYYRYMDYKTSAVFRGTADKRYGFSIRCVKD